MVIKMKTYNTNDNPINKMLGNNKVMLLRLLVNSNEAYVHKEITLQNASKISNIKIIKENKKNISFKHVEYNLAIQLDFDGGTHTIENTFILCRKCGYFSQIDRFIDGLEDNSMHNCCTYLTNNDGGVI